MENKRRYSIKKILLAILWITVGTGTTVLLVAGVKQKDAARCKAVEIKISGIENNDGPKFVDDEDILNTIQKVSNGNPVGKSLGSFELKKIETELALSAGRRAQAGSRHLHVGHRCDAIGAEDDAGDAAGGGDGDVVGHALAVAQNGSAGLPREVRHG